MYRAENAYSGVTVRCNGVITRYCFKDATKGRSHLGSKQKHCDASVAFWSFPFC